MLARLAVLLSLTLACNIVFAVADPITQVDYLQNHVCTNIPSYPSPFPAVEWGGPEGFPASGMAYTFGTAVNVKLHEITTASNSLGGGTMGPTVIMAVMSVESAEYKTFDTGKYGVSQETFPVSAEQEPFIISGPAGGDVTLALQGLPTHVRGGRLKVTFRMVGLDQYFFPHTSVLTHEIDLFLVLDTPKKAMSVPWTEVLRDATSYAATKTGEDVPKFCTWNGFKSGKFVYGFRNQFTDLADAPGLITPVVNLDLTALYGVPYPTNANCADVNSFLVTCLLSVGLDYQVAQCYPSTAGTLPSVVPGFTSNPVCLVGSDPAVLTNYQHVNWDWHAVAQPTSTQQVFDITSAAKLDLSGVLYQKAVADWPMGPQGYWQKDGGLGVVYSPLPSAPFVKQKSDVVVLQVQ